MEQANYIPRRERGTRATQLAIASIAEAGVNVPLAQWLSGDPRNLDSNLRARWNYVPDGDAERIRTVDRMYRDWTETGVISGDCDDAATLAVAALLRFRTVNGGNGYAMVGPISIVAARPARSENFEHVFVVFDWNGEPVRVDPTAPETADYTTWELSPLTI